MKLSLVTVSIDIETGEFPREPLADVDGEVEPEPTATKPGLLDVLIPDPAVYVLGAVIAIVGLMLPLAVVIRRAQRWEPAPLLADEAVEIRPALVILPPGSFQMGSPDDEADHRFDEVLHEVHLSKALAVSQTEVTQAQYRAVTGSDPEGSDCEQAAVGDDLPVSCVSWNDAIEYCNKLSALEGLSPPYTGEGESIEWNRDVDGYRLLTEAEWEYAARAGSRTRWVGTDDEKEACRLANVADQSGETGVREILGEDWPLFDCDDGFETLSPVEALEANPWHLYGFGGNVAEWVWDGYEEDLGRESAGDPAIDQGEVRVIRGGSWRSEPRNARVAYRFGSPPSNRSGFLGFRVARSALPSEVLPSDPLP